MGRACAHRVQKIQSLLSRALKVRAGSQGLDALKPGHARALFASANRQACRLVQNRLLSQSGGAARARAVKSELSTRAHARYSHLFSVSKSLEERNRFGRSIR